MYKNQIEKGRQDTIDRLVNKLLECKLIPCYVGGLQRVNRSIADYLYGETLQRYSNKELRNILLAEIKADIERWQSCETTDDDFIEEMLNCSLGATVDNACHYGWCLLNKLKGCEY